MKILLFSHSFSPNVGGIETVSLMLAHQCHECGHEVVVVTQTLTENSSLSYPFAVHRRPGAKVLLQLTDWCDVYFHNNISLQTLWPLLLRSKPWVIVHQTWIAGNDGRIRWQDRLKLALTRWASNIAISTAIAQSLPVAATVIGNPYDADVFRLLPHLNREQDLVFLGRLVTYKGVDILLEAMALLHSRGLYPSLSIIGSGPEQSNLVALSQSLGLTAQVHFLGILRGEELVRVLNHHRVLVVPSRWQEPFGIVALEGIACGCVVIGSAGGGLADAIGPCGVTFPNGDKVALANQIESFLRDPSALPSYQAHAPIHLQNHLPRVVTQRYVEVFTAALLREPFQHTVN